MAASALQLPKTPEVSELPCRTLSTPDLSEDPSGGSNGSARPQSQSERLQVKRSDSSLAGLGQRMRSASQGTDKKTGSAAISARSRSSLEVRSLPKAPPAAGAGLAAAGVAGAAAAAASSLYQTQGQQQQQGQQPNQQLSDTRQMSSSLSGSLAPITSGIEGVAVSFILCTVFAVQDHTSLPALASRLHPRLMQCARVVVRRPVQVSPGILWCSRGRLPTAGRAAGQEGQRAAAPAVQPQQRGQRRQQQRRRHWGVQPLRLPVPWGAGGRRRRTAASCGPLRSLRHGRHRVQQRQPAAQPLRHAPGVAGVVPGAGRTRGAERARQVGGRRRFQPLRVSGGRPGCRAPGSAGPCQIPKQSLRQLLIQRLGAAGDQWRPKVETLN